MAVAVERWVTGRQAFPRYRMSSLLQCTLICRAIGSYFRGVTARSPGPQVGHQRWRAAKQHERGSERERSDRFGRQDRHASC